MNWFYRSWYVYLFTELDWCDGYLHKLKVIYCRIKGHPDGPVWYSSGFEPDMSCRNCGDEL